MKIHQTPIQLNMNRKNETNKQKNVSFNGAFDIVTQGLRFLEVNQAWGANFVDFGFMVTPRTAVDFTRGPDAGFETMRRESTGTLNHTLIGVYGAGSALLLAQALNKKYNVEAHKIFASDNMVDTLSQIWQNQAKTGKKEEHLKRFLNATFENVEGFNPEHGWTSVNSIVNSKITPKMKDEITKNHSKINENAKNYIKALIGKQTGAESKFRFRNTGVQEIFNLDTFIDNTFKLGRIFKDNNLSTINSFTKEFKRHSIKTSLLGIGIACILGIATQPVNVYITKKKTGKTGFVGGDARKPDKSTGFKFLKGLVATGFSAMVLSTLIDLKKFKNPKVLSKELLKKVQFKGLIPTIGQFKIIYGATIVSRFFAARDKDELREATIKDTLGFLNWIILGNVVTKAVAAVFEKTSLLPKHLRNFLKYDGKNNVGWFKKLLSSEVVSRDEVIFKEMKDKSISILKSTSTGEVTLAFKERLRAVSKNPAIARKITLLNIAQVAGYIYSGLVLGIGIPKLNIAITKQVLKNRQEKTNFQNKNSLNLEFLNNKFQSKTSFINFNGKK